MVSDGVGRRAGVFEVVRLRRRRDERVGALGAVGGRVIGGGRAACRSFWDTCERAHRRPGLPGCLEAWRLGGLGGLQARKLGGFKWPYPTRGSLSDADSAQCRRMYCTVLYCTVRCKATPAAAQPRQQQAKATGVHATTASKAALQIS